MPRERADFFRADLANLALELKALPSTPRARIEALAAGDWVETGANLIAIGNSDRASYCSPRYVIGT